MSLPTPAEERALRRLSGLTKFYEDAHADTLTHTPAAFRGTTGGKAWAALPQAERRDRVLARLIDTEKGVDELAARDTPKRYVPPVALAPAPAPVAPSPASPAAAPLRPKVFQPVDASGLSGAFVACAGGCGAWITSRSTYEPALSVCPSHRR
jgi:hypothetical protein